MQASAMPVVSMRGDTRAIADSLGKSFREFGFAMVSDHGIDLDLLTRGSEIMVEFFALPEQEKRSHIRPGLAGARGYTPFGAETAKGATAPDLKEFWHVGRDLPASHRLAAVMPPNVWPDHPQGFRETFSALFAEFDRLGTILMRYIALDLELDPGWFESALVEGNSVLRLLHYPPVAGNPGDALRAGAHEDINLITLLPGTREAGLELLARNGRWIAVSPPDGVLVVNIGDMLQRLTNHVLPSTTHRVRNPLEGRKRHSRYAMPFFVHPRGDYLLETLQRCVTHANPDRYPVPITADDYLQARLFEIGLRA